MALSPFTHYGFKVLRKIEMNFSFVTSGRFNFSFAFSVLVKYILKSLVKCRLIFTDDICHEPHFPVFLSDFLYYSLELEEDIVAIAIVVA